MVAYDEVNSACLGAIAGFLLRLRINVCCNGLVDFVGFDQCDGIGAFGAHVDCRHAVCMVLRGDEHGVELCQYNRGT